MIETIKTLKKYQLSEKFKKAIKEEFEGMNLRIELIINQGGIQRGTIQIDTQ